MVTIFEIGDFNFDECNCRGCFSFGGRSSKPEKNPNVFELVNEFEFQFYDDQFPDDEEYDFYVLKPNYKIVAAKTYFASKLGKEWRSENIVNKNLTDMKKQKFFSVFLKNIVDKINSLSIEEDEESKRIDLQIQIKWLGKQLVVNTYQTFFNGANVGSVTILIRPEKIIKNSIDNFILPHKTSKNRKIKKIVTSQKSESLKKKIDDYLDETPDQSSF